MCNMMRSAMIPAEAFLLHSKHFKVVFLSIKLTRLQHIHLTCFPPFKNSIVCINSLVALTCVDNYEISDSISIPFIFDMFVSGNEAASFA